MNYLLDTHILLWYRLDPGRVSPKHRAILSSRSDIKFISSISIWEISLKFSNGKLSLDNHSPEEFLNTAIQLGFQILASEPEQFASFHHLPEVLKHKDPFDRMLIWQAIQNNVTLLSQDTQLPQYSIHGLKLL